MQGSRRRRTGSSCCRRRCARSCARTAQSNSACVAGASPGCHPRSRAAHCAASCSRKATPARLPRQVHSRFTQDPQYCVPAATALPLIPRPPPTWSSGVMSDGSVLVPRPPSVPQQMPAPAPACLCALLRLPPGPGADTGGGAGWARTVKLNLEIVKALERECLAPVFVYMYDPAWALLRQIWPAVEATLGGPCVMEPSFAAFRLNFRKASTGGACVFVPPPLWQSPARFNADISY